MKDCEGFFTVLHNQQVNATHTPKVKGSPINTITTKC